MSDPISTHAPDMTLDKWARTTNEGRLFMLMRKLTKAQLKDFLRAGERLLDASDGGAPGDAGAREGRAEIKGS